MIIHIASDEKFIESANWMFEKAFPNQNIFLITLPNKSYKIKYLKHRPNYKFIYEDNNPVASIRKYISGDKQLVILHNLDGIKSKLVLSNFRIMPIFIWLFWGSEIYENPNVFKNGFISSLTKKTFLKETLKVKIKNIIRPLYFKLKNSQDRYSLILEAAKRIRYFGVLFEEELTFLQQHNILNQDTQFIKFTYYPIEFIFKNSQELKVHDNNILIGNSSSLSNNHLDILLNLVKTKLKDQHIYMPLSYGNGSYRVDIIKKGKKIFGEKFHPLIQFMPVDEYNTLLSSCGFVIMNHHRQQAVGTVLSMVWMGAKVFLSNKNSLYSYLKRIGIHVYSIEYDLSGKDSLTTGLSKIEIDHNRDVLMKEIGERSLFAELKHDLRELLK